MVRKKINWGHKSKEPFPIGFCTIRILYAIEAVSPYWTLERMQVIFQTTLIITTLTNVKYYLRRGCPGVCPAVIFISTFQSVAHCISLLLWKVPFKTGINTLDIYTTLHTNNFIRRMPVFLWGPATYFKCYSKNKKKNDTFSQFIAKALNITICSRADFRALLFIHKTLNGFAQHA